MAGSDRHQDRGHGVDRGLLGRAYEVLEARGLEVILANAHEARAVPGRKSDVNDAQWLQRLHACGLLRAIVAGERDPDKLAAMRAVRCKESQKTIRGALVGNYQPEHLFALKQALALYDFYRRVRH